MTRAPTASIFKLTVFENKKNGLISIFPFWHFQSNFVVLKLSITNVNVARFARNVEWDFFWDFQTPYFAYRSLSDKKAKRCNICGKIYVSMPAYAMHLRTHNQNCKCSICGKTFSRPWLLQGHLRTHTGKLFWPFFCISHCLKISQNVSFGFSNFGIFTNFWPKKTLFDSKLSIFKSWHS